MKCPLCKENLQFKERVRVAKPPNGTYISHYDVDCININCQADGQPKFWGFACPPDQFIDDYSMVLFIDGKEYGFGSVLDFDTSYIYDMDSKLKPIKIQGFHPITDESNEEFFKRLVIKILNLKAFL